MSFNVKLGSGVGTEDMGGNKGRATNETVLRMILT